MLLILEFCCSVLISGQIFSSMLATHIYVVTFGLAGLIHRERKWNWPGWYRSIAPCSTIQHPTISYSYIPHRIEHHTKPYHTRPFWLYWWRHSAMSLTPSLCPLSPFIQICVQISICICVFEHLYLWLVGDKVHAVWTAEGHVTSSISVLPPSWVKDLWSMTHKLKFLSNTIKTADN